MIETSFDFITTRNSGRSSGKKYDKPLFHLNSCLYFASACYTDYLIRYGVIDETEKTEYMNTLSYLPFKYPHSLKNHTLYAFDSLFNRTRQDSVIVCYIYKLCSDGTNTIHTFILESNGETNIVYNSWLSFEPNKKNNKKYIINELTGKREYPEDQDICSVLMPPTKVIVKDNVFILLNDLFTSPTLEIVEKLFGLSSEHILTKHFDLKHFKNASMFYTKLIV